MAYCSKCGKKLEEGDIYCPDCGTKNIESNDNIKSNDNVKSKPQHIQSININDNFKVIVNTFINMFLKPVTTAKKFINEAKKDVVILLTAFVVIIQGFLGIWRVNQIISSINSLVESIVRKIIGIMSLIEPHGSSNIINSDQMNEMTGAINRVKSLIKIPYGEIFLQGCVLILISILVIFIMMCIVNSLWSKGNGSGKFRYYKTALIIVVPYIYFEILSIIFSYLSIDFGVALNIFGFMVSLVCFAMVVNESLPISQNQTVVLVSITGLIVIIVLALCLGNFMPSIISSIVSSIMNNIKSLNI